MCLNNPIGTDLFMVTHHGLAQPNADPRSWASARSRRMQTARARWRSRPGDA